MVPLLPVAVALAVLVAVESLSRRALERYATGLNSLPTVVLEEFPEIDRDLLEKYTSFDPELGWCPQPNVTKQKDTGDHLPGEEVRSVVTYSTDEYGSRLCPARDRPARDDGPAAGADGAATAVDEAGADETAAGATDVDADESARDGDEPTADGDAPTSRDDASAGESVADDREPVTVSTYGDSYCFCREVDDDETFQHYLAQRLETHVGNYGGGNYGLDQALLRMKRQYPEDPTDYVLVVVTASSIARILSVWKHYQEFGNVLAVKPRYDLRDGELELLESPVDEKEELLDLEAHAPYMRLHDDHYEQWFQPHHVSRPYARGLLRNPDQVRYCVYEALRDVEERLGRSIPGVDVAARQRRTTMRLEQPRVRYHEQLYEERSDLFEAIVGEFVDYAEEQGFTPVFAMVGQLRYAKYEAEHGPVYGDLVERLDEQYDDLIAIDVPEHFPETGDAEAVESLYVERGEGGHYSPETNERIADLLVAEVFEESAAPESVATSR